MHDYTLTHLCDAVLIRDLLALVARDRATTATLLAHIAEVDDRKLFRPAGYPSMHAYCVDELHLSEDAAKKRIQAARASRQFPMLFTALAEGRLHLGALCMLAPHLTSDNAAMLVEAATHKSKCEIEEWLAHRYPLQQGPAGTVLVSPIPILRQPAPEVIPAPPSDEGAPGHPEGTQVQCPPQNCERFLVQLTISRSTRDKLRYVQSLLSHAVPSGDVAQVLDRALDVLILQLERRKTGSARRPRASTPPAPRSRYVPAHVRRAVWERDRGRCTFVSASGTRCNARRLLEFDHVDPVARGGRATVDRMRLRCRAHNQYEAERAFGSRFMERKRDEARAATAKARAATEHAKDVLAGLRNLGCRANEARRAVEFSENLGNATLDERMRAALRYLSLESRAAGERGHHDP